MARGESDPKEYVTILSSDGSFRKSVPEGTAGAIKREYEVNDKKGVKYELKYNWLSGKITNVEILSLEWGDVLQITLVDDDGELTITTQTSTNFAGDLMKKLPNVDLTKEVKLTPYSFEPEPGKVKKGVSVEQDGEKIKSYFWDEATSKSSNGFPEPEGDTSTYTKNKWKKHFMDVQDFLVEFTKTKFAGDENW